MRFIHGTLEQDSERAQTAMCSNCGSSTVPPQPTSSISCSISTILTSIVRWRRKTDHIYPILTEELSSSSTNIYPTTVVWKRRLSTKCMSRKSPRVLLSEHSVQKRRSDMPWQLQPTWNMWPAHIVRWFLFWYAQFYDKVSFRILNHFLKLIPAIL